MTFLYATILQNYLNEQLAEFTRTGRTIFVGVLKDNLIVLIQGFNDKMGIIANKVLRILKEFRFEENHFYLAKEEIESDCTAKLYRNDFWAEQYMMKLILTPVYTVYELLNETKNLNFESTKNFIYQEFLPIVFWTVEVQEREKKPYLQELESYLKTFTGNFSQIDPIYQSYTQFNRSKIYRERNLCVQSRTSVLKSYYVSTFMNTSLFNINSQYQNLLITYQLLYNQIFYVLRRHETLAYSPSCIFEISPDLSWFYFQIQILSHHYSPEYLSSRIQNLVYQTHNSTALQANFKVLQSKIELIRSKFRSLKQKTRKDLKRILMEVYKYEDSLLLQSNILDNQVELLSKFINLQTDELSTFEEFLQLYKHIFKLSPRVEIQIYRQGLEIPTVAYPDSVGNFSSLIEGIKETEVELNYFKSFELFDQKNQLRQISASQSQNSTQTLINLVNL